MCLFANVFVTFVCKHFVSSNIVCSTFTLSLFSDCKQLYPNVLQTLKALSNSGWFKSDVCLPLNLLTSLILLPRWGSSLVLLLRILSYITILHDISVLSFRLSFCWQNCFARMQDVLVHQSLTRHWTRRNFPFHHGACNTDVDRSIQAVFIPVSLAFWWVLSLLTSGFT